MAGFGNKVKTAVLKGMEAVGQSASNLATNAQQKLQELNLETQRREIISDFPLRAYDLWQKGEAMPEPLDKMLKELSELDERLSVLRAQRYTHVDIPDGAKGDADAPEENGEAQGEDQAKQAGDEAAGGSVGDSEGGDGDGDGDGAAVCCQSGPAVAVHGDMGTDSSVCCGEADGERCGCAVGGIAAEETGDTEEVAGERDQVMDEGETGDNA